MSNNESAGGKVVVTGGAGFIGSHVVDALIARGWREVMVLDDLRTGQRFYLDEHLERGRCRLVEADVTDFEATQAALAGAEMVVHFQANADVRGGVADHRIDLEQNTLATWNVGEACCRHGVKTVLFASSATVYGEPAIFPTPESEAGIQTSLYGASKLAGEAMLQAFSEYAGFDLRIFRFVSWIGPRYSHGVIFDFFRKLRADPRRLPILGDGRQRKSYLDVRDGIAGIFAAVERAPSRSGVFNLGHDEFMPVTELARIVVDEMGLGGVEFEFAGGERGWVGDSPVVHLDTSRIKRLGWRPAVSIEASIRDTVRYLMDNETRLLR